MIPTRLATVGLVVLAIATAAATPRAQTVARGPQYLPPAWDQTLPSSTRFIVLSNMASKAVLDLETGLVWERSPSKYIVPWSGAHVACNELIVVNRKGWRLPTLQELASLMDPSEASLLPADHPFILPPEIGGVAPPYFWSATTSHADASAAWMAYFGRGIIDGAPNVYLAPKATSSTFAWCVRGGQDVDPR